MAIDSALKRRRALRSTFKDEGPAYYLPSGGFVVSDRYQRGGFYYNTYAPITGDKIIFTAPDGVTTLELDPPLWGYKTTIKMPLYQSERADGSVGVFDAGVNYDRRVCECTFQVNFTDAGSIIAFFRDKVLGRGNQVTLTLPAFTPFDGCRWFPFGPDKGDYGVYTVQIVDLKPSGQQIDPFRWWNITMKMLYIDGPEPEYSLPAATDYGNIQIGDVSYLRYPESTFQSEALYNIDQRVLMGGSAGVVDNGYDADQWRVTFELSGTRKKFAELLNYLTVVNRNATTKLYPELNIVTQDYQFIFGRENSGAGAYSALLLNKVLDVTHVNFDLYKMQLSFQRTATL